MRLSMRFKHDSPPRRPNWRGPSDRELPPALASPFFAEFNELRGSARLARDDEAATFELCGMASKYYDFEMELEVRVAELLGRYVGVRVVRPVARRCSQEETACLFLADPEEADERAWLLLAVMQVRLGSDSLGESCAQGAACYADFWAARPGSPFAQGSCRPALLLEVLGPHLRVSALYGTGGGGGGAVAYPLTDFINLLWFGDDLEAMASVGRHLAAVKTTIRRLRAFYSQPPPPLPLLPTVAVAAGLHGSGCGAAAPPGPPEPLLPYPLAGYQQVQRAVGAARYAYTAALPGGGGGQRVAVRFVRRYGAEAQAAWAAAGLAPALRRVQALPDGWLLVEEEVLDAREGWVRLASLAGTGACAAAAAAAQEALRRAHAVADASGRVFAHGGMMRARNVMVREAGGAGTAAVPYHVRFVDFEVAGADGVATYPLCPTSLGGEDCWPPRGPPGSAWPPGVAYGEPVLQAHDTALLAEGAAQLLAGAAGSLAAAADQLAAVARGGAGTAAAAGAPGSAGVAEKAAAGEVAAGERAAGGNGAA